MTVMQTFNISPSVKRVLTVVFVLLCTVLQASAAAVIKNLQVEYRNTPLGIDVAQPRFSWQMATTAGERGYAQTAYKIEIKDSKGNVVWDTKRTDDSTSLGMTYAGRPLKAATRYSWTVTVWNQAGAKLTASSWFETGLMDPTPDSSAWGGAKWIGGGDEDLVLYAPYLAIFDVKYALTIAQGSTRAAFVYGGGADFNITSRLFLRAEYRGFVYNSPTFDLAAAQGTDRITHRAEPSVGFGYRF